MVSFLRLILVHIWVACVAGVVTIAGIVMGYVSVATFIWAGIIGLAIGVPAGLLNWAYLRPNRSREIGWTWSIARWARAGFGWNKAAAAHH